jgi:hypothetical protein
MVSVILITTVISMNAQNESLQETTFNPRINVKMSALAAIGIINPAVEFQIKDQWSMQIEGMGVFAPRNFLGTGYPLQLGTFFIEGRYYFKKVFNGFFIGPNIGGGAFRMNKNILHKYFGWAPDLNYKKDEKSIQTGESWMAGLTLGYVHTFKKNPHWSIEVNWSLGRQWARYESYTNYNNGTIKEHTPVNGSAEYMPFYKGGIFLAYKW